MSFQPERSPRRSIRLRDYDYTAEGMYFITICTYQRVCCFGEVVDSEMRLNEADEIVVGEWFQTAALRSNVELDAFVVMPNHVHGIVVITDAATGDVGAQRAAPLRSTNTQPYSLRPAVSSGSLGAIVRAFKSAVTRRINLMQDSLSAPLWQRNYYEHIIRSQKELNRIRAYIENNPSTWETDAENPNGISTQM